MRLGCAPARSVLGQTEGVGVPISMLWTESWLTELNHCVWGPTHGCGGGANPCLSRSPSDLGHTGTAPGLGGIHFSLDAAAKTGERMRSQMRRKPLALPTWALGLALVSSDRDWRGLRCTRHLLPHSPRGLLRSRPGLGEGVRPWLPLPGGEAAGPAERLRSHSPSPALQVAMTTRLPLSVIIINF